jgi:hypothetical protein
MTKLRSQQSIRASAKHESSRVCSGILLYHCSQVRMQYEYDSSLYALHASSSRDTTPALFALRYVLIGVTRGGCGAFF